ncbi:MAG: FkbM family methyltransferase [Gallionellaceae bacterium]|nr:MAG: FkbM family methyltransferase [Gallionellaceae bacterium]
METSADCFQLQQRLVQVREPVIFDVGAHKGDVSKIYRALFPSSRIYAFEPFPQSFQELTGNVGGDAQIHCFELAISNIEGRAILNGNKFAPTNSLLQGDKRGALYWGAGVLDTVSQVEVKTTSIDSFCVDAGIPHIDILKIDVQGAEFSVLEGCSQYLKNHSVSLIYAEFIMCPTYKGQHTFYDYVKFLNSFGYEFHDLCNPIRNQIQLMQADLIFISSSFKKEIENRFR